MRKNTSLNFNGTNKGAIGQLKKEAAKGPLGYRIKQPPILFENNAVWRKLVMLIRQLLILLSLCVKKKQLIVASTRFGRSP